jgi:hypothetical protein
MTDGKPKDEARIDVRSLLDPPRRKRWHDYALERLPGSLLIALIVLLIVFPLMTYGAFALLRLLSD